jgi:hypothetical protein
MIFCFNEWLASAEGGKPSKVLDFPKEAKEWLAVREREAAQIDPGTAELWFDYGRPTDPYNFYPDVPNWSLGVDDCVLSCLDYVCRRDGDVIVWTGDLSDEVLSVLERRHSSIPHIWERSVPARPIRYFRNCSTTHGRKIKNIDRAASPRAWSFGAREALKMARAAARAIDRDAANVCLAPGYDEPPDFDGYAEVEQDPYVYRNYSGSQWSLT